MNESVRRTPPVKRRRRRKRNMSLYYIIVAAVVLIAVYVLTFFVFFRVDSVKVSGTALYDPQQVVAVSGIKMGDNLFRTDISEVEKTLLGFMVYADEIKVRRKLPSSIEITVVEAEPLYNLEQNGRYFLVSKSGKILEADMVSPRDGLIIVKGYEIKDENVNAPLESNDALKGRILEELAEGLETSGLKLVNTIDMTDRTDIKLSYDDRIEIRLGSSYDISYKLNYTKAVIDSLEESYGGSYRGELIYHSATSGMSAIQDDTPVTQPPADDETPSVDDSSGDNSSDDTSSDDTDDTSSGNDSSGDASAGGDDGSGEQLPVTTFPLDEGIDVEF